MTKDEVLEQLYMVEKAIFEGRTDQYHSDTLHDIRVELEKMLPDTGEKGETSRD